jgi:S1-C subfamily serine protease
MNERRAVVIGVIIIALGALAIFGNLGELRRSTGQEVGDVVSTPAKHLESEDEEPVVGDVAEHLESEHELQEAVTDHGVIILDVEPEGPADVAGIVRGDILLDINEKEVDTLADIREILADHVEGDIVELTVLHGDEIRSLEVTLGEGEEGAYLGITGHAEMPRFRRMTAHEEWVPEPTKPLVLEVFARSPAEEAGLKTGDVILSVDGEDLGPEDSLAEIVAAYNPGDKVTLKVRSQYRADPEEIVVVLTKHPEQDVNAYLGIRYMPMPSFPQQFFKGEELPRGEFHFFMSPGGREMFEFPFPDFPPGEGRFIFPPLFEEAYPFPADEYLEGVMVREVVDGSPAEEAGLQEGDIIASVNGEPVGNAKDLSKKVATREPGEEVELIIFRAGEESSLEITVRLGEHPEKVKTGFLGITPGPSIIIQSKADVDMEFLFDSFLERMDPLFQGRIHFETEEA